MFNSRRKSNKKLMTGIFIGSAAGSILAFLFTPKTGKELRQNIAETFDTSMDTIKDTSGKIYNSALTATTGTVNRLQAAIQASINKYRQVGEEYRKTRKTPSENIAATKTTRKRTTSRKAAKPTV
ncbi:MAG: YtxH domain-containing protein [Ignavibacteria bacterium]|jgi:gas vesicle protein|nr:YtxH domain-containing protein [Ignavibacteria bacterium]MCU7503951.1 YtxH domain-containing protein [Ignavibacteria bacterium]MCU7515828.1 YtxH domain-containing protein [Ignavibacteria bacterium]